MRLEFARAGTTVTLTLGYAVSLTHECGSEANAEAWRFLLQRHADNQAEYARNAREHEEQRRRETEDACARLKRSNAQLRGVIRRLRARQA